MTERIAEPAAALAMIEAFAYAGAKSFEVTFTDEQGEKVGYQSNRSIQDVRRNLASYLTAAVAKHVNFIIRPRTEKRLIQLDDLTNEQAAKLTPFAFLAFETSPGNSQVWLAVNGDVPEDFTRRLKKGTGADVSASGATRLAGSLNFKAKYAPDYPRVTITHSANSRTTTAAALTAAGLLAPPETPPRVSRLSPTERKAGRWPDYERNLANARRDASGEPDRSNADFVWCMTAIDWGHSIEATAEKLAEFSEKAQAWKPYATLTATNAAAAVARNRGMVAPKRGPSTTNRPH